MITVQIAMEAWLLGDTVEQLLGHLPGFDAQFIRTEAASGAAVAGRMRPDVVVLGEPILASPARSVAAYRVAAPDVKVVLLLLHSDAEDYIGGVGADAIVDVGDGPSELAAAIKRVVGAR